MIICCTVPKIWHVTDVLFVLGNFLPFYSPPPNNPKTKISKKWEKTHPLEISSFNTSVPKIMIKCFTEIWCATDGRMVGQMHRRTDRWTDGWTDGKSEWWVPNLKKSLQMKILSSISLFISPKWQNSFFLWNIKNKLHCYECTYTKTKKQRPPSNLKV